MKLSRLHTMLVGIVIMIAGAGLFLDIIGLIEFDLANLWPVILLYFGLREWSKGKRVLGGILTGLGTLLCLHVWFNIQFDDVFSLALSLGLIYFGFQLFRSRKGKASLRSLILPRKEESHSEKEPAAASAIPSEEAKEPVIPSVGTGKIPLDAPTIHKHANNSRSALIGDFHMTSGRFELSRMNIWHGVGNVVIDLSRAVIQEEEAVLAINGWIGDITVYVPVDLPVSVTAEVKVGDLGVFGNHQGGLNRSVSLRSDSYDTATPKVQLNICLILGDIDVKYI